MGEDDGEEVHRFPVNVVVVGVLVVMAIYMLVWNVRSSFCNVIVVMSMT